MNRTAEFLIDGKYALGEGPMWHPLLNQLFYFDINNKTLYSAQADGTPVKQWHFDQYASAAAVIDADNLAIFTETGLQRLNLKTGEQNLIVAIEADDALTRCNDGRVDRAGGFWMGTMRKEEDDAAGALYRYRAGKLDTLLRDVKIPNATCFSPDGSIAYFADTDTGKIMQCKTDTSTGEPTGEWVLFADINGQRGHPDGAVTDSEGYLWNARWGGNCVVRHAPDGSVDQVIEVPVSQVSCPAFGGPDLKTLFITTAAKNLTPEQLAEEKVAGGVFAIRVDVPGLPETPIKL